MLKECHFEKAQAYLPHEEPMVLVDKVCAVTEQMVTCQV